MDENKDINGIVNNFKNTLYERISSPFLFSFFIGLLAWNYKLIFILFSEYDTQYIYHYIDNILYPDSNVVWDYFFFNPLFTAIFFLVVLYPVPTIITDVIVNLTKLGVTKARNKILYITPISQEEARDYRKKISELLQLNDEIDRNNRVEIKALKQELEVAQGYIKKVEENKNNIESDSKGKEKKDSIVAEVKSSQVYADDEIEYHLNTLGEEVYDELSSHSDSEKSHIVLVLILILLNKYKKIKRKDLEKLIRVCTGFSELKIEDLFKGKSYKNMLSENGAGIGGIIYSLSDEGKKFLLKYKLDHMTVERFIESNFEIKGDNQFLR